MHINNTAFGVPTEIKVETRPDFATGRPVIVLKLTGEMSIVMSLEEANGLAEKIATTVLAVVS